MIADRGPAHRHHQIAAGASDRACARRGLVSDRLKPNWRRAPGSDQGLQSRAARIVYLVVARRMTRASQFFAGGQNHHLWPARDPHLGATGGRGQGDAPGVELNAGAALPDLAITPVERGDSSGTNFVFSSYLSTQSDDFRDNVGHGKTVKWPGGQLGQKNDGVTSLIKDNKGAIGYIELNYALANNIPFATLKNKDGSFVKPSTDSVSAAGTAGVAAGDGSTLTVNIWNQSGADVYPISTFTYIIVYKDLEYLKDPTKAQTLVDFLTWATTDGQSLSAAAGYAPLSADVQKKVGDVLSALTYSGQPLKKVADAK